MIFASQILASRSFDPSLLYHEIIIEVNEVCNIARRNASQIFFPPYECGRVEARHAQGIFEPNRQLPDAIAHRPLHGEIGARQRSILELEPAIDARYQPSLQLETMGPACGTGHRIADQYDPVERFRGHRRAEREVAHMMAIGNDAAEAPSLAKSSSDHSWRAALKLAHCIEQMGEGPGARCQSCLRLFRGCLRVTEADDDAGLGKLADHVGGHAIG